MGNHQKAEQKAEGVTTKLDALYVNKAGGKKLKVRNTLKGEMLLEFQQDKGIETHVWRQNKKDNRRQS